MIGVIDTGRGGNLGSVLNACRYLGVSVERLEGPERIEACRALLLPGVGAFGDYMDRLRARGFFDPLREWLAKDRPFLGICLGLQALFESSEEAPGVEGLGALPGTVRRFQAEGAERKVPQIGWNRVRWRPAAGILAEGLEDGAFFYFVHSYYAAPEDDALWAGETDYGVRYASAVRRGRLVAAQFHPEKSQAAGLRLLRNFGQWLGAGA